MQQQTRNGGLKKTPLHDLHQQLNARMVAFAGYTLPVQYRGIRDEHLHTRAHASLFDISHMGQFLLSGDNVVAALETLVPNHIATLTPGQQRYSVLLNEAGGVVDDVIITRTEQGCQLIVNAACKDKDWTYLQHHLPDDVLLHELRDHALIAIQGPEAAKALQQLGYDSRQHTFMHACPIELNTIQCHISRCGYTGEDGFEISLPANQAENLARELLSLERVQPAGLGARDTLRLEAGLSLYGHELDETVTPIEAGLDWLISAKRLIKSNYVGREVILQQVNEGADRLSVGIVADGKAPVREGVELFDLNDNPVGKITSGTYSPTLAKPIALARVDNAVSQAGTRLIASQRGREIPVHVSQLPFVAHRYYSR